MAKVSVLFLGEANAQVHELARVPCVGEFIYVKDATTEIETYGEVLTVTFLAWDNDGSRNEAEIHCGRIEPMHISSLATKRRESQNRG